MADNAREDTPSPDNAPAAPQQADVELPELSIGDCESKAEIRTKVWEYLEANNLASFPRPVKNRIPNYKGSAAACDKITELDAFRAANTIKINPDKPQEQARFRTLETNKTLLVPTPRLRKGLFNKIQPQDTKKSTLKFCSTSQGVKQYSSPLGLDMKIKVDLVVLGSVAVSTSGWRIGKGEGFADLEYGMMASVGAVNEDTLVVTSVHDCQVMDLPDDIFGRHDVTIDYICTPTRIIECSRRPKPKGIIWSLLSLEKFLGIPILKVLREQEKAAGVDVTLEDASEEEIEEALVKQAEQPEEEPPERDGDRRRNRRNRFRGRGPRGGGDRDREGNVNGVSSMDGGEHADGEESPSGEKRRYNNNRRRRIRNRRRTRDSEHQNSEGEQMSPLPPRDSRDYQDRDGDGGPPRRRRQRRFRRGPGDRRVSENDDQDHSLEDHDQGRENRRPAPRRRNRQRRSEGDYEQDGPRDQDNRRRGPRKFGYQNRRPRNDDRRHDDDHSGDQERDSGSPSGDRRRRERSRRNNNLPTIYVGSLPKALRVSVFKKQVRDMDVNPLRVLWRGSNGHVFLIFETMDETEAALQKLENLSINDKEVKVAMANRTERRRGQGDNYHEGGAGDVGQARSMDDELDGKSIPQISDNIMQAARPINSVTTEL